MKIHYLGLFFLFLSSAVSASIVNSIMGVVQQKQHELCRPGNALRWTLRTDEGKDCKTRFGAMVARMACVNYPGFEDSACARHANGLGITNFDIAREHMEYYVRKGQVKPIQICNFISRMLLEDFTACRDVIKTYIEALKNDPPPPYEEPPAYEEPAPQAPSSSTSAVAL